MQQYSSQHATIQRLTSLLGRLTPSRAAAGHTANDSSCHPPHLHSFSKPPQVALPPAVHSNKLHQAWGSRRDAAQEQNLWHHLWLAHPAALATPSADCRGGGGSVAVCFKRSGVPVLC